MYDVLTSRTAKRSIFIALVSTASALLIGLGFANLLASIGIMIAFIWIARYLSKYQRLFTGQAERAMVRWVALICYLTALLLGLPTLLFVIGSALEYFGISSGAMLSAWLIAGAVFLPVWLQSRLFRKGWQYRQERHVRVVMAIAKESVIDGAVGFSNLSAAPIYLTHEQQAMVKRWLRLCIAGLVLAAYFVVVVFFLVWGPASSVEDIAINVSVALSALTFNVWTLCLAFRVYNLAWRQGGASFFSPWEESLIGGSR